MTLHALVRYEFHAAVLRRAPQQEAFDDAVALVLYSIWNCPQLRRVDFWQ